MDVIDHGHPALVAEGLLVELDGIDVGLFFVPAGDDLRQEVLVNVFESLK